MTAHHAIESRTRGTDFVLTRSLILRAIAGKFGALLCALIALLLSTPLIAETRAWNLFVGLFASSVLVASLHAARSGRRALVIGLVLATADFAIGRLVHYDNTRWLVALQAFVWLALLVFVVTTLLGAIFERDSVDVETLQAALCVYLMLGLLFAYFYALVALAAPASFAGPTEPATPFSNVQARRILFMKLMIMSFATLSSSGYEGLVAATPFANVCMSLEAMTGQVYLAVVIARLVGMQAVPPARAEPRNSADPGELAHVDPSV